MPLFESLHTAICYNCPYNTSTLCTMPVHWILLSDCRARSLSVRYSVIVISNFLLSGCRLPAEIITNAYVCWCHNPCHVLFQRHLRTCVCILYFYFSFACILLTLESGVETSTFKYTWTLLGVGSGVVVHINPIGCVPYLLLRHENFVE